MSIPDTLRLREKGKKVKKRFVDFINQREKCLGGDYEKIIILNFINQNW